jgi:hypothetical protein
VSVPSPADVEAPPGLVYLPRRPARSFVGRDDALRAVEQQLQSGAGVVTQAVYGLGGIGKSELALQYAHAHRNAYRPVWWVTADDPQRIEAGLASLGQRLCPVLTTVATTPEAAEWALSWLQTHTGWLLVLDNVEDPRDIDDLLGQLLDGHLLITTRRDVGWDRVAAPLRLDSLDRPALDGTCSRVPQWLRDRRRQW